MASSSKGGKTTLKHVKTTTFDMELQTTANHNQCLTEEKDVKTGARPKSSKKSHAPSVSDPKVCTVELSFHTKQIECLYKTDFFKSSAFNEIGVKIEVGRIILTGSDRNLLKTIKDKINSAINDMKCHTTPLNNMQAAVLTKVDVVNYIDSTLAISSIPVAWEVTLVPKKEGKTQLSVYSFYTKEAKEIGKQIMSCIKEEKVSMEESRVEWFEKILEKESSKMTCCKAGKDVVIYTTLDIHEKYFTLNHSKSHSIQSLATVNTDKQQLSIKLNLDQLADQDQSGTRNQLAVKSQLLEQTVITQSHVQLRNDPEFACKAGQQDQLANSDKSSLLDLKHFICLVKDDDDFVSLLHITENELWYSRINNIMFDKGKIVFEVWKSTDLELVSKLIKRKLEWMQQLSETVVSMQQEFQGNFLILQKEVETIGEHVYCILSIDRKRIIIKATKYDQFVMAKHKTELLVGIVKPTTSRRNRRFILSEGYDIASKQIEKNEPSNELTFTMVDDKCDATQQNTEVVYEKEMNKDRKLEENKSDGLTKRQHDFPTPSYWSDMKGEFSSKIELEEDGYGKQEWQDIKLKIHGTLPHAKIVSIHRIQNMFVWEKYWVTKKEMETHNGSGYSNEMLLFHGTTADKLNAITIQNLDPRLAGSSSGTLLGKGTYFAIDANYSDRYAKSDQRGHKFMFLVRVLVGKSCRGNTNYLRPPLQDPSDLNNHKLFDSCVDNVENPTIYCVFDRTQYYPEYLIEYL